jgi:hypothetical protein
MIQKRMNPTSYSGFESQNLLIGHRVSLGNYWNQVDLRMKSAHNLNVQWLQSMAGWLDEVHTGVNSVVDNVHAVNLVLGIQVGIEALLNVIHNWSPRLVVVDEITKTRGINNSQT